MVTALKSDVPSLATVVVTDTAAAAGTATFDELLLPGEPVEAVMGGEDLAVARFGVELETVRGRAQHAGEHLDPAVRGEDQRPPAVTHRECLDVLADLAVEVRPGVRANDGHHITRNAHPRPRPISHVIQCARTAGRLLRCKPVPHPSPTAPGR